MYLLFLGKKMESTSPRIDIKLVSGEERAQKLLDKTFKYCTTYIENLCAITLENKIINFREPINIGKI